MLMDKQDLYVPASDLPGTANIPAANTELVLFDTTKIKNIGGADQKGEAFGGRQTAGYLKRAFLSVFVDQPVSYIMRHLSAQDPSVAASWRELGTPVAIAANALFLQTIHLFGDDHQIIVKTGGTPPTILIISLRFSLDQALAE